MSGNEQSQRGRGRPTDYKPEFCQQVAFLCEQGATNKEVAEFFEVSDRTILRWANLYPDFCRALKLAKAVADDRVERSLYHKAVGYTFDSVKIFQHNGEIVEAKYLEHVPPDTTAAIFWLKNRRPEQWRDKSQQEHTGPGGGPIQHEDIGSLERLASILARQSSGGKPDGGTGPAK